MCLNNCLEILEDKGLYLAIIEVKDETSISLETALQILEQEERGEDVSI